MTLFFIDCNKQYQLNTYKMLHRVRWFHCLVSLSENQFLIDNFAPFINYKYFTSEKQFGFLYKVIIHGEPWADCIKSVQEKDFILDGWNGDYPIYKATTRYSDGGAFDVYLANE